MTTPLITVGNDSMEGIEYPNLEAFAVPLSNKKVVDFFNENWNYLSPTGRSSLLKSLSIPESYFNRLTAATQVACLAEAQADLHYDLMMFVKDKTVEYVARQIHSPESYVLDPLDFCGLLAFGNELQVRQSDYVNGRIFFIISMKSKIKDEYIPAVQVCLPLFYTKDFQITSGLYKVVCTNGMIDAISSSELKLKFDPDPEHFGFGNMLSDLVQGVAKRHDTYKSVLDALRAAETNPMTLRSLLDFQPFLREIAGTPVAQVKKHVSLLLSSSEVPWGSPPSISNWYDVVDTMTYYSARSGENTEKRRKMDRAAFNFAVRKSGINL